jgi:hypothetical protein
MGDQIPGPGGIVSGEHVYPSTRPGKDIIDFEGQVAAPERILNPIHWLLPFGPPRCGHRTTHQKF